MSETNLLSQRDRAREERDELQRRIDEAQNRINNRTNGLKGELATDVREILRQVFARPISAADDRSG